MFQGIMILEISGTDLSQLKNMKSYRPVFDNNCFDTNSTLFIPTFKSL